MGYEAARGMCGVGGEGGWIEGELWSSISRGLSQAALQRVCLQCKVWDLPSGYNIKLKGKGNRESGHRISWNFPGKIPCLVITLLTRNDILLFPEAGLGIPLAGLQIVNKLLVCGYFGNSLNI